MLAFPLPTQGFRPFETFASKGELPPTFPKGRRCALGACGCKEGPVELSIYNGDETCAVCTSKLRRIAARAARQ